MQAHCLFEIHTAGSVTRLCFFKDLGLCTTITCNVLVLFFLKQTNQTRGQRRSKSEIHECLGYIISILIRPDRFMEARFDLSL